MILTIHEWSEWLILMVSVGKYTSSMHPMGLDESIMDDVSGSMLQNSIFEMKSEYLPSLKPTNRHGKCHYFLVNAIKVGGFSGNTKVYPTRILPK